MNEGKGNRLNRTSVSAPDSTRLLCLFSHRALPCAEGGKSEKWKETVASVAAHQVSELRIYVPK